MKKLKKIAVNTGMTLLMPVAIYLIFFLLTRIIPDMIHFGSLNMVLTILAQSCMGILIALALCINMPTGRVDMSVGAVVVLSSIVSASLTVQYGLNIVTMMIISIICSIILQVIMGIAYTVMRIPMIVLSLGIVIVYEALTGIVFGGNGIAALNADTRLLGYQPYCFILAIGGMIIFHIVTEKTRYAYDTKLLSGGQAMAVRIGIKEKKNVVQGFIASGFFLGLAAMIYVSNYGLIEPASNMSSGSVMFSSLLPVIIGLILAQFSCKAIGVAVSVISMKMVSYGLFCLGFNSTVQDVVSGAFILILVVVTGKLAMRPEQNRIKMRAKTLAEAILQ